MANIEERLRKIDNQMKQLKVQKQALVNREKQQERKDRTRRLIQNGALAEKFLQSDGISPAEFEKLLERIVDDHRFIDILVGAKSGRGDFEERVD
jgi:hypothetical protein